MNVEPLEQAARRLVKCEYDERGFLETSSEHVYSQVNDGHHIGRKFLEQQEQIAVLSDLVWCCYRALHRNEWEDGETEAELSGRINDTMHSLLPEEWEQLKQQF